MTTSTIITIAVVIIVFIILFKVFKWVLRLLVVAVFIFIAYLTNPVQEQHQEALSRRATKEGLSIKGTQVEVDDYYVFSLTNSINTNEEKKVIGAGAFTQVVIFRNP
jgi:multisubunit Na+/H+ antiporter MnhG subunit